MKTYKIPDFPHYEIDKEGNVYSKYIPGCRNESDGKLRKKSPYLCFGYWVVDLVEGGERFREFVHRLLLRTFVGEPKKGQQCRHLNGDKTDNRLENLVWGTRSENQMDRVAHGNSNRGEGHGMSKLTAGDVLQIRAMNTFFDRRKGEAGSRYRWFAERYGVAPSTIGAIITRRSWAWL